MTQRKNYLSKAEIDRPFKGDQASIFPPVLCFEQVAKLLGVAPGTLRQWLAQGHFDGCYRKRGKRLSFWRGCVVDRFFNGPDWKVNPDDK